MNLLQKKACLAALVMVCLVLAPSGAAAGSVAEADGGAADIAILIDGDALKTEVPPYINGNYLMLPVRAVFEALGATVDNPPGTLLVTGVKGDTTVQMEVGSPDAAINGHTYGLPVPVQVISNHTLAPVRFVAEALNCYVSWDQANQTALILSGEKDWNGYPGTADAVVAAIIIAHGHNWGDVLAKYYYEPSSDGVSGDPFYSALSITKIEEITDKTDFAYSTAESISSQTGLPCKAFYAEWNAALTDYAKTIGYTRPEGDMSGWFYMVQQADGTWKAQSALNTGP